MSAASEGFVRGAMQAIAMVITAMILLAVIAVGCFTLAFGLGAGMASMSGSASGTTGYVNVSGKAASKNKLLVLRIEGPILGTPPRDRATEFFMGGVTYGYEVQHLLEQAAEQGDIKGVLLHVQTPGGTIFGSRAIHDGVVAYRQKSKKPVVVYVEGLAASGGVMAVVGATKIYADYGSLIGSIGVLGPELLFYNRPVATDGGLLDSGIVTQNGIEQTVISAGRSKDIGNPFRRPTEEEIATLTHGVELEYDQFVRHVAKNRHMDPAMIRDKMGALIFDNATAQQFGLIDGTANRKDTIQKLADLAGVSKDFQMVRPGEEEGGIVRRLLAAIGDLRAPSVSPARSAAQLIRAEFCTAGHGPLVYYGDPGLWCK